MLGHPLSHPPPHSSTPSEVKSWSHGWPNTSLMSLSRTQFKHSLYLYQSISLSQVLNLYVDERKCFKSLLGFSRFETLQFTSQHLLWECIGYWVSQTDTSPFYWTQLVSEVNVPWASQVRDGKLGFYPAGSGALVCDWESTNHDFCCCCCPSWCHFVFVCLINVTLSLAIVTVFCPLCVPLQQQHLKKKKKEWSHWTLVCSYIVNAWMCALAF